MISMRNQILSRSVGIAIAIFFLFNISKGQADSIVIQAAILENEQVYKAVPPVATKPASKFATVITHKTVLPPRSVPGSEVKPKVHPNPFIHSLIITTFLSSAQPLKVQLLDMSGSLVRYKSINGLQGENSIEFNDLGNLQAGVYMVRIIKLNSVVEQRIIKSKN
jgi:hypothetical protein